MFCYMDEHKIIILKRYCSKCHSLRKKYILCTENTFFHSQAKGEHNIFLPCNSLHDSFCSLEYNFTFRTLPLSSFLHLYIKYSGSRRCKNQYAFNLQVSVNNTKKLSRDIMIENITCLWLCPSLFRFERRLTRAMVFSSQRS